MAKQTQTPVISVSSLCEAYFDDPTESNLNNVCDYIVHNIGGAYIELTTRRFRYLLIGLQAAGDRVTDPKALETIFKAMQYRTTGIEKWIKAGGPDKA